MSQANIDVMKMNMVARFILVAFTHITASIVAKHGMSKQRDHKRRRVMGIFDIFKKKVEPVAEVPVKKAGKKKVAEPVAEVPVKKARKKKVAEPAPLSENEIAKAAATEKGEPWVSVLNVELDIDNLSNGAFTLDWNDKFITNLVRAGYKGTDVEMVDQWFAQICRNVLAENFEQEMSDPDKRAEHNKK